MICSNCKKDFDDTLNYCPYCGTPAKRGLKQHEDPDASDAPRVRRVRLNLSPELFEEAHELAVAKPEEVPETEPTPEVLPEPEEEFVEPEEAMAEPEEAEETVEAKTTEEEIETSEIIEDEPETVAEEVDEEEAKEADEEKIAEEEIGEEPELEADEAEEKAATPPVKTGPGFGQRLKTFGTVLLAGLTALGFKLKALGQAIGRGFKRMGRTIGPAFKTAGKNIKKAFRSLAEKIQEASAKRKAAKEAKSKEAQESEIPYEDYNRNGYETYGDRRYDEKSLGDTRHYGKLLDEVEPSYYPQETRRPGPYREQAPHYNPDPQPLYRDHGHLEPLEDYEEWAYERGQNSSQKSYGEEASAKSEGNALVRLWNRIQVRMRPSYWVALIVVLVLVVVLSLTLGRRNPTKDFSRALADRDYQKAGQIYEDRYQGNAKLEAKSYEDFSKFVDTLKQNALDGKTSYAATTSALNIIKDSPLYTGKYKELLDSSLDDIQLLQEVDVLYAAAKEKQNQGNHEEAIRSFNKVLDRVPSYRDTAELLSRSRERYREEVVSQVTSLQSQRNYREALNRIDKALALLPEDPILLNLRANTENEGKSGIYNQTKTLADRAWRAGNMEEVVNIIKDALKQEAEDKSLQELSESYKLQISEEMVRLADELFMQGDKEAALEKIEEGLKLLPDSKLLKDSKNRYEAKDPNAGKEPEGTSDPSETTEESKAPVDVEPPAQGAIVKEFDFTGDTTVVDSVRVTNADGKASYKGVFRLGEADKSTQIYYQVYAVNSPGHIIMKGNLYAKPDDMDRSSVEIEIPTYGGDVAIDVNYQAGGHIKIIVEGEFGD